MAFAMISATNFFFLLHLTPARSHEFNSLKFLLSKTNKPWQVKLNDLSTEERVSEAEENCFVECVEEKLHEIYIN